ncbi:MAG: 2,4-dihydroxyhept-2-ene-1,7-dioic acid aldolase [Rhodobacteraceae bacterium]|nr:MAG: 2,4-dihydroxyhept-2-ene-1,7-dioic acid aldolase [Paracoccaceae bacterium]
MTNPLKEKWRAGTPTLNGWCGIGSSFSAEIMAAQGFDSVTIDVQHGALSYTDALPMAQAIGGKGATVMARVPWREPGIVMKMLDAGAMGIICPMINNADEAAEFASFTRYPPRGQRSYGPTRAAFAMPGYNEKDVNEDVIAFAMIETADGVENLEEIAATPGIDGLYVGPSDLSIGYSNGRLSAGFDRTEDEMVEVIKRIAEIARKNNIAAALHCGAPDYAANAIGWGYNMVTVSADTRFLAAGANAAVTRFRELTGTDGKKGQGEGY